MIVSPLVLTAPIISCAGSPEKVGRLLIRMPPIVVADQSGTILSPCSPMMRVCTSLTWTRK
ncbi:MAG: hypothetical protein BWX50_01175 [Euryarchaeota archaeon ADurb.Bin009]|nr:MAG: hypothetical protein BWX50_01175 [Euryarchaeota archaeon ADurb.Bin009]